MERLCDVRFGSKADMTACLCDVRFTPESGHHKVLNQLRLAISQQAFSASTGIDLAQSA
jgi:hypothetical protein